jgi:rhodanese-related sulfurtransferase
LQQLEAKADETTLIVFCHHGVRSLNVVYWLREQGVPACQSNVTTYTNSAAFRPTLLRTVADQTIVELPYW